MNPRMLLNAVQACLATLVLTGVLYPLAITTAAKVLFPRQASGSLVVDRDGRVLGSALIGQRFTTPAYVHGRPSAAGQDGYDALASSGSNLGPSSERLRSRIADERTRLEADNPMAPGPVPPELLTASGSGLDPHVSPEVALWQVPRIAAARDVSMVRVRAVILDNVEGRELGILGEPRVNVLLTNLALDRLFGAPSRTP